MFAISCAQQAIPIGGPKDTIPPKIVESIPENLSVNQRPTSIELTFDEFVTTQSLNQELLISPPFKELPKFYQKGKSLIIELKEELQPNTTYTFNFGEGISDLNEGNRLDSNLIVFSTGTKLDSGFISGKVEYANEAKPAKDFGVLLYDSEDDSVFCKSKPLYYTKCDKFGQFEFAYLKAGNYKLFALEDKNSNLTFDLPNELIGFVNNKVNTSDSLPLSIAVFEEDNESQFIQSVQLLNNFTIRVVTNIPTSEVSLRSLGYYFKSSWYSTYNHSENDTLLFYLDQNFGLDSLLIETNVEGALKDTSTLFFDEEKASFSVKTSKVTGVHQGILLKASLPFSKFNIDSIELWQDSTKTAFDASLNINDPRILAITPISEGKYDLKLFRGAVELVNGAKNDTLEFETEVIAENKFVSIVVQMDSLDYKGPKVVYLLNAKNAVISEIPTTENQVTFSKINIDQTYNLKMLLDRNGDGKWTTGNFGKQIQPESYYEYGAKIELQSGFDTEIIWNANKKGP